MTEHATTGCFCPCHIRGVPTEGYTARWRDDRDILHEDWVDCSCDSAEPADCNGERT